MKKFKLIPPLRTHVQLVRVMKGGTPGVVIKFHIYQHLIK